MQTTLDCTAFGCVITCDRLAWARTLVKSIREYHSDARCFVLVVDEIEDCFKPEAEILEVIELFKLPLGQLSALRFKYTPFELCCALKPVLLQYLLKDQGFSSAIYFDVDIMVLSRLDSLIGRFDNADVLLTPHVRSDLPSDGKRPDDAHIMKSGIFNAGFVGVRGSDNGLGFLNWWWDKCRENCVVDHFNGFFVDQKYLDLAVGMFEGIDFVDDPGCNVAYWNLHERNVEREQDRWCVNGRPMLFFHFSDYRLDKPQTISGHQDRCSFESMPDLKALFDLFRERVLANGDQHCRQWSYGFGNYRNGRRIADRTRRAFRLMRGSKRPIDPFDSSTHPLSLKLSSAWQGVVWLVRKVVDRLIARRQIRFESQD